jgi:hypothetical protein
MHRQLMGGTEYADGDFLFKALDSQYKMTMQDNQAHPAICN